MNIKAPIYEISGLLFSPTDSTLESTLDGRKVKLPRTLSLFLLALVQNGMSITEYDDLRQKVWTQYPEMSDSLKHLIQETKRGLIKLLKKEGLPNDFIEPVPGKGYFINTQVKLISDEPNSATKLHLNEDDLKRPVQLKYSSFVFKCAVSMSYGLLFSLGLFTEIAYQFDRFGNMAMILALPLVIWNGGVLFAVLTITERSILKMNQFNFWIGLSILGLGAISTCLAMFYLLPSESVTDARFQTQPAFAAFLKGALIYLFPLGAFGVYLPYYFLKKSHFTTLSKLVGNLFKILSIVFIFSLLATFYLLDNLLPSKYHGLFVTLIFIRLITYFGLGFGSLIWVKMKV